MASGVLSVFCGSLLVAESRLPTREIFGNVPPWSRLAFYALSIISIGVCVWGVYRRRRLWRLGRQKRDRVRLARALQNLLVEVVLQSRLGGRGLASFAHWLLLSGFLILLIGTILIGIEHWAADLVGNAADEPLFHYGTYFTVYEFVLDSFGIAFIAGCAMFLWRRFCRPASVAHVPLDWVVLGCLLAIGVTGYLVEGLRMIAAGNLDHSFSYVGLLCARAFSAVGVTPPVASTLHLVLWWLHAVLALGWVAALPYTRLLHAVAGAINIARTSPELGIMAPISIEEVEQTGRIGAGRVVDFTRKQLLELDACVACGRCEEACPAFAAGKPLSPKRLVQDIRAHLDTVAPALQVAQRTHDEDRESALDDSLADFPSLHGEVIRAETLWACTTCHACVDVCPLRVDPLEMITDMRRHLIGEGELRGAPATSLQKAQRSGNPWGLPKDERIAWAAGLEAPSVAENPDFEYLYWVGCAAAYDARVQKVAQSFVRLLNEADVNFAVLGTSERCTGESARRMGDEFVFQELAAENIKNLHDHKVRKIVTHCPHCLNSLRNDYPQFGGQFEVIHHSQLLAELISTGRLRGPSIPPNQTELPSDEHRTPGEMTFHDPCYLARVNAISTAPRQVLAAAAVDLTEPPRNRRQTACCGAGGGRMWFDDAPGQRVGRDRVDELLATRAQTIVTACPFCLIMTRDAVMAQQPHVEVKDVAEVLVEQLANHLD